MAVGVAVGVAVSGGSGVCSVGFEHVCNACVMNLTPEEQRCSCICDAHMQLA